MSLNKDFYYDKQEQQLSLLNDDQEEITVNLTKPIVKKRSNMLYSQKLVRDMKGPSQSIKLIESIYQENDIDAFLLKVDLLAEQTGSCLVSPSPDETKEYGIRLQAYGADNVSVISLEDQPDKPEAVSILRLVDRIREDYNLTVERIIKQQIWTETEVIYYEGEIEKGREPNELGFIPFANFKAEEVNDQYLGHSPTTGTRKLNETYNQLFTDLGFMIKMQAFTPIALSGFSNGETISIHPGRALSIPAGATAGAIGLDPKIMDTLETLKIIEEKIYETSSVPKVSVVGGGEANSGRELLIRWFPLYKVFQEKKVRYEKYELELANLILDILGLPHLETLKVNYSENGVIPFSAEEDTLKDDILLNIKTPIDEVMRRNPTLTEDEAQSEVMVNALMNNQLKQISLPQQQSAQNTVEDGVAPEDQSSEEQDLKEQKKQETI
jgi:hypothetical protein